MNRNRASRLVALGSAATIWLGVLAAPATAANPVRWVDDNAGGDGGPAACATAPFTSIQDAIDASSTWDRVYVCPGTYAEQLTLDVKGVLVRSAPAGAAHIASPDVMLPGDDGVVALVRMPAWSARLIGFQIDINAGEPNVNFNGVCTHVDVAVLATGLRARVKHNAIDSIGDATWSGRCGYDYGIVYGEHNVTPGLAPFDGVSVGRIQANTVTDFKRGGILVEEPQYIVRVRGNTISYLHADDPGCDFSIAPSLDPCAPSVSSTSAVNEAFVNSFGIGVESGAAARVRGNVVESGGLAPPLFPGLPTLGYGVALQGAAGATVVRGNTISNADYGILSQGSDGVVIRGNTVLAAGLRGIWLGDDGHDVFGNTVSQGNVGMAIEAPGAADNAVHDNDFRGNGTDCLDTTIGTGTSGTANTWYDNLALNEYPNGLCGVGGGG